jgi:hypothetical protein
MFPIDLESKKTDVEIFGLLHIEHAQDGSHIAKAHGNFLLSIQDPARNRVRE